jgi:hypothetical protein
MAEIVLVYNEKWPTVLGIQQSSSELITHPNVVLVSNISKIILLPFCVLSLCYGITFTFTFVWLIVHELTFYVLERNKNNM